jgi:hypothetical protein
MADANFVVSSFLGGEWSQTAQGAIAEPKYKTAMNACLNGYPIEPGAWIRRSGSRFCATTRGAKVGRLIAFTFQEDAPYNMEFTDNMLRFFNGPTLVPTNDAQAVTAISAANPAEVTTGTHGWSTGNTVMFNSLGVNNPLLHNRQFVITVTSSTKFTIADAITGTNIDGSTLGSFVSGNVTRVLEIATTYGGTTWTALRIVQAEVNAVLLHPLVAPQLLSVTKEPTNINFAEFQLVPALFKDGPYLDPVTGGAQLTPSAISGSINLTLTLPAYSATTVYTIGDMVTSAGIGYRSLVDLNINNTPASSPTQWRVASPTEAVGPNGFQPTDIGRHIRLLSEPPLWSAATNYVAGNAVTYNGAYYTALGATIGTLPGTDITKWAINATASVWTWGKITGLLNIIPANPAGSSNIGNMTTNGGLAAAFDGNLTKPNAQSATIISVVSPAFQSTIEGYVGKDFGGTPRLIASASLVPSTDFGIALGNSPLPQVPPGCSTVLTVTLRGKNSSAPATPSDGTALGVYTERKDAQDIIGSPGASATTVLGVNTVTIVSNDQINTYRYVWFDINVLMQGNLNTPFQTTATAAQVQFIAPGSGGTAGVTCDIFGQALPSTSAIRTWRMGLLNSVTGWPSCGTYHEGRLWLSGTIGNRIDGSVPITLDPNGILQSVSFEPTKPDGTVTDANAIDYTFDAQEVNKIFHMTPDHQGIIVGTQSGEWLVQASALNNPLTPVNIQAHRVTRIGCANIEPRRAEHTLVIVQKFARKLVEYFADIFSGKFTAPNLSEKAKHLSVSGIAEIAYQQELTPIMWARLNNGKLVGMTYKRDTLMTSQGPTFNGWHRHTLGSGRLVDSICVGPNHDGTLDSLAMITFDPNTLVRHVELLVDQFEETDTLVDGWFLDDAVVPSAYVATGSNVTFYGLWHLNGANVTIVAGGLDLGDYAVSNGAVVVTFGAASGLFTSAFVSNYAGAMPCLAGFTYTSQGQIVRAANQQESGARIGPGFGKFQRTDLIAVMLNNTQGIKFGGSFDKMNNANFTTPGGTAYTPLQLFSGLWRQALTDSKSPGMDSMVCWQISRPYPATVAAIGGFLRTEDQ